MNRSILIGNLTKDPETSTTNSGVEVARFTLAVKRNFKNQDGEYEADFINCVAWRKTAELVDKFVSKGDKLGIVGRLQTRSYDAQNGSKNYVTEVIAEEIEFLNNKGKEKKESEESKELSKLEPIDDNDLPF